MSLFKESDNTIVLSIEGNIGAGKSTFLRLLRSALGVDFQVISEPVNEWIGQSLLILQLYIDVDQTGINMLDLLYKDAPRWSYTFQSLTFYTKLQQWEKQTADIQVPLCISERSIYTDRYIFAPNFYRQNSWSQAEWTIYTNWFDFISNRMTKQVDGILYLRTRPETCLKRCQKRDRSEESALTIDYFQQLDDRYEEWLNDAKKLPYPVLTIDTDQEFESNLDYQITIINEVKAFYAKLKNKTKENTETNQ